MTTDSISADDWRRVKELTAEIVTLSGEDRYEASDQATHALLDLLVVLQDKYGPLPSLLAMRADYVYSVEERETLLQAAHREAVLRADVRNQAWVAYALAAHYLDAVRSDTQGEPWLAIAEQSLRQFDDEQVAEELARLRGMLNARQRRQMRQERRGRRTRG